MSKVEDDLDVAGQHLNLQVENVAVLPATAKPGRFVFNTADLTLYVYNGTLWVSLGGGGGGSYYYIASTDTVTIKAGQAMNILAMLRLNGTLMLDGMIVDDFAFGTPE